MILTYEDWHYTLVREVFGQRGIDIMVHAVVALATDGRDRVDFDKSWAVIRHTVDGLGRPYTVIHEFAHLYHVKHWPEVSLSAPTYRCEAAACLAELRLAHKVPQLAPSFGARHQMWSPGVRHLLSTMPPGQDFDLHEEMGKTLAGAYG